jgi:arginyl-tRNA synthetase
MFCFMKDIIVKLLVKESGLKSREVGSLLEVPPSLEMGDFAFPCFGLAKKMKKSPVEIASGLARKIKLVKGIERVESEGAYVNFFVDRKVFFEKILERVKESSFGKLNIGEGKKVGVEYPSPNTNKALHVGHLRNMAIGGAVCNLVKNVGSEVVHLNLFNDRGILISKSMIGYERFGEGKVPDDLGIKGDKFVGDLYVKFSKESKENPELEELAKEKLRLWEAGDKDTLELWREMNGWAYKGMQETFDLFGLSNFDKSYYESDIYKEGRGLVKKGLKAGVFVKKDDAIIIDLESEGLGEKVFLRSDGTSVYITQDLFLAEKKVKDFNLDSSYYVVGSDQEYHFKVLFSVLDKLGLKKDWRHLSYGMVSLPSGKMSSREGTSVGADDLIRETCDVARKGIVDRASGEIKDLEKRTLKIALAAIKYALLKVDVHKSIVFDSKRALSFEGNTGPYLLYSYARASSILRKVENRAKVSVDDLKDIEIRLLRKINDFENVVFRAYEILAPNLIANYCFEMASLFNEFYHACPVLGGEKEGFRLAVVEAFRKTLGLGLDLLGIDKLEEM